MPKSLVKTLVCSYIELAFDALVMLVLMGVTVLGLVTSFSRYLGPKEDDVIALIMLFVLMGWFLIYGIFKFVVVLQLRKQKYWAWVASIIISALNFFSFPYLILGIIKLVGLLNHDSTAWFKVQGEPQSSAATNATTVSQ